VKDLFFCLPLAAYHLPLTTYLNYFNYFSEIEETFVRRRGKHLLLSPIDWALIETWQERKVPLHVVVRGIEKVFDLHDQRPKQTRSVKSLFYCKEEIEAQFAEWLERQVGKNGSSDDVETSETSEFSDDTIKTHLETIEKLLEAAEQNSKDDLRETLQRVLSRLAELKQDFADAETLESALEDLEKLIDAELMKTAKGSEFEKEIQRSLAAYKSKMETEVYQKTFDLMLLKRLREQAEIPRLSLFYL
jgi:Mor family transcriptional regulator